MCNTFAPSHNHRETVHSVHAVNATKFLNSYTLQNLQLYKQ